MRLWLFGFLAILAVAVWADCSEAQSNLVVPGTTTTGDDITTTGRISGSYGSFSKTLSCADVSCPTVVQAYLIEWDEGAATGKAWPDTFGKLAKRYLFTALQAGTIYSVTLGMADAGSGWDSLKVDVMAGTGGDTTVFDTEPMLEPGDGDYANTIADGRTAVLNGTVSVLAAGENVFIEGEAFGNKADAPSGVKVWVLFQPSY